MVTLNQSTDPSVNRKQIENAIGKEPVSIPGASLNVDRGVRLVSNSKLIGSGQSSRLVNATTSQPFGDSSTLQVLQGHDFWIGYADSFTKGKTKAAIILTDPTVTPYYTPGTLVWTWKFTHTGVTFGPPRQNKVKSVSGTMVLMADPVPDGHDTVCWTVCGVRPTAATEGQTVFTTYDSVTPSYLGKSVLVSDGEQIANESRGEIRTVVEVQSNLVRLDKPLRCSYKASELIMAPVNVVYGVTIDSLTIGNGPIGWSFFGKYMKNFEFRNVLFEGVCEMVKASDVTFIDCTFRGGLKMNNCHKVRVLNSSLVRVSFEECCTDIEIDGFVLRGVNQLPGISCDPQQFCERLTIRNGIIMDVVDFPFLLEGRECLAENIDIQCGASSALAYIAGNRSGAIGVRGDRGLVMMGGKDQYVQNTQTPSLSLGWVGQPSAGTAFNVAGRIDNQGGWTVV